VRRFSQQKSQTPDVDDKTTISSMINGLTLSQTTSHLSREEPQTMEALFHELEKYCRSDDEHRRRVVERYQLSQNPRNNNWSENAQHIMNV
jgi:hypothetical protein